MINFQELVQTFGSRMKVLEILCLLNDCKDVVRQGFYEHELQKVKDFCGQHGLFIEISRNKLKIEDNDFFSNRGVISDSGMLLVYISKDELKAAGTCLFETRHNHRSTGLALGYPDCCVRYFCEQFAIGNINPVHQPTNQWTNLLLREQDICLVSHFPCSSDCAESIAIAQRNFDILRQEDEKMARLFFEHLQQQDG
ncbi:MAG TPA: hypothetical protein VJH88_04720 [Candidatus Nanoarchaeia archaeon]|nr:hypothetical protein [Candidatus Nanoarchaeia archaeon]